MQPMQLNIRIWWPAFSVKWKNMKLQTSIQQWWTAWKRLLFPVWLKKIRLLWLKVLPSSSVNLDIRRRSIESEKNKLNLCPNLCFLEALVDLQLRPPQMMLKDKNCSVTFKKWLCNKSLSPSQYSKCLWLISNYINKQYNPNPLNKNWVTLMNTICRIKVIRSTILLT